MRRLPKCPPGLTNFARGSKLLILEAMRFRDKNMSALRAYFLNHLCYSSTRSIFLSPTSSDMGSEVLK